MGEINRHSPRADGATSGKCACGNSYGHLIHWSDRRLVEMIETSERQIQALVRLLGHDPRGGATDERY